MSRVGVGEQGLEAGGEDISAPKTGLLGGLRGLAVLVTWLRDTLRQPLGYRLARLRPNVLRRRSPATRAAIHDLVAGLARDPEIKAFLLPDDEILVIHHQTDGPRVLAALNAICALDPRDRACSAPLELGRDSPLVAWSQITTDGEALLAWAEQALSEALSKTGPLGTPGGPEIGLDAPLLASGAGDRGTSRGRPLTPEGLAKLENALVLADLSNQVRRQRMVMIGDDGALTPVMTELFVDIAELRQTIAPQVDLFSNAWLFRRFTATLDQRMTAFIGGYVAAVETPAVSLNLNVATLLGPGFGPLREVSRRFPQMTLIVELRLDDVMADLPAYLFAREYLHHLGFKVLIDGLGPQAMLWLDRKRLGADYLKAQWSHDLGAMVDTAEGAALAERIRASGSARTILCRCDDSHAVEVGRKLGCGVFQGFYLDDLLREGRPHDVGGRREEGG
ncbi:diguanylate phosphodiesterase [Rhodospirillum rubrum F11]|uniref:Diguanylate phosphodiesterase (EAL domain) n=1 Tax=Rhodospirillum rubrum (strain ATCC 11170 / ATH 1.1.1 / DSM 467 / LMG 4362 / NCIMB 8255 / S1) TaxID=269796 RepID=Q2RY65_RHORT|nr:diguanylate phosphodiesterase [Rhodospirillum rubrum]ABC20930.1 diguanylate phosphodiesterase (EAL domain) [Rhodospirillum rubrum ATCC 11170]AEO46598.1 diguanylate phosphodiesterase [Rhodospirillum rubrum F11]QXG80628.1 EAL domain-containing protein [Rhodospirillum rubrum]